MQKHGLLTAAAGVWTASGTDVATTQAAKKAAATAERANFGNGGAGDLSVTATMMSEKAAA